MVEPVLCIEEKRATYLRNDGSYFSREDIYLRLSVTFRDEMLAKLRGAKLSAFLCVCLHCNRDMKSFPSIDTICRETGYGHSAISPALLELVKMGLLAIQHKPNGHQGIQNHYTIKAFAAMGNPQVTELLVPESGCDNEADSLLVPDNGTDNARKVESKNNHIKKNIEISNEISVEQKVPRKRATPSVPAGEEPTKRTQIPPEWRTKRHELEEVFTSKSNVKLPPALSPRDYKKRESQWWGPLKQILFMCEQDMDKTKELIGNAVDHLKEKDMPICDPNSIVKTCIWLASKQEQVQQTAWRAG